MRWLHLLIMRKRMQYRGDLFSGDQDNFLCTSKIFRRKVCRWVCVVPVTDGVSCPVVVLCVLARPSPVGKRGRQASTEGSEQQSGPRTRNLKPAEAHWAVCLQEILEPLSVLSGRDNRCQQTCTRICAIPPTLQDTVKRCHILKLQPGALNL